MLLLAVPARPATAGGKKVKAEMLCGVLTPSPDGGDPSVTPVPGKGKPRLDRPVACAVHQTTQNDDDMSGYHVTVQTSWTAKEGPKGKKVKHQGPVHQGESIAVGSDYELTLSPALVEGSPPDFEPCVDFKIDATIASYATGVVWKKSIKVPQKCPKPPKAKLACTYESQDGVRDALSGKVRIETPVTCRLSGLDLADGAADAWIDSQFGEQHARVHSTLDGQDLVFTLEPDAAFQACGDAALSLVVVDDQAVPWFKTYAAMKQYCPD